MAKILIAGTSSGVGKTTITLGLIAALRKGGWRVQPFKAGPDYIDPTYHTLAAGRPCRNIDTWMVPPDRAVALFDKASAQADVAVIEGVMGLFDGFSYENEAGSSAQIAKLVEAPVLLILDVGQMARSAGAVANGYTNFDPALKLAGFILNRCGSESHYKGVKQAVERATGLPVLGWLPKDATLHIPERHLGLIPTDERGELTAFIDHAADIVERHFDLDQILTAGQAPTDPPQRTSAPSLSPAISGPSHQTTRSETISPNNPIPQSPIQNPKSKIQSPKSKVRIAVARDAAFSFYYEDNLDLLREAKAEIVFFSPLANTTLPAETSGIYLGGGFPEMFAAELAANASIKQALRQAHAAGLPIYAECGGFMYLTEAIIDLDGQHHPMVGLVPGLTRMQPRLISLGYRIVESPSGNFLLPAGTTTRGHEFHWSTWERPARENPLPTPNSHSPAWTIQPRRGSEPARPDGYVEGNLIASYVHLHFAHDLQLAPNFVRACHQWRTTHAA